MPNEPHTFLLTTPRGIAALRRALPTQHQDLERACLDALTAHRLLDWCGRLSRASRNAVLDARPHPTRGAAHRGLTPVHPRTLASLESTLQTVQAGFSALLRFDGPEGRTCLATGPEHLDSLRRRQAGTFLQGPDGFISVETLLRDAAAAHLLEARLRGLFKAAADLHISCRKGQGRPEPEAHKALAVALDGVGAWNQDAPRVAAPGPRGKTSRRRETLRTKAAAPGRPADTAVSWAA